MKTIGSSSPRRLSSCCRSGPVMLGMAMSRIKHGIRPRSSEARNSFADENARAAKPSSFSKSGSDSRTDSSSSTTDTTPMPSSFSLQSIMATLRQEDTPRAAARPLYFGIHVSEFFDVRNRKVVDPEFLHHPGAVGLPAG